MQFGRHASKIKKYITLNKYFDKSQRGEKERERESDSPGIPWMYYGYTSNCRPNFPLNVSGDYIGLLLYVSRIHDVVIFQWNSVSLSEKRIPDLHWFAGVVCTINTTIL